MDGVSEGKRWRAHLTPIERAETGYGILETPQIQWKLGVHCLHMQLSLKKDAANIFKLHLLLQGIN